GLALVLLMGAGGAAPALAAAPDPALTIRTFLPFLAKPRPAVDLSVSRIEIIQGINMAAAYRVQVAKRPALVRVFVGVSGAAQISGVTGRLTRYVGSVAQDSLDAGPITAPVTPSEGSLNQTLNFTLPANWLAAGTGYVLQLDPGNAIAETNEA